MEVQTTLIAEGKFKLPAVQETRLEIAKSLGFDNIADVRNTPKESPAFPKVKEYAKLVKESAELVEVETGYPNIETIDPTTLQEKLLGDAKLMHRAAILAARRKGEDLPIKMHFQIFDLMGIDDESEDEGEYDKDQILVALEAFCVARNLNDTTSLLVQTATIGTKASMLKLRKFFKVLGEAQEKFIGWLAENEVPEVEFDAVAYWMKRQNKRLQSAIATPDIDENEIQI